MRSKLGRSSQTTAAEKNADSALDLAVAASDGGAATAESDYLVDEFSVGQLKKLLIGAGVSFAGAVEKRELRNLVRANVEPSSFERLLHPPAKPESSNKMLGGSLSQLAGGIGRTISKHVVGDRPLSGRLSPTVLEAEEAKITSRRVHTRTHSDAKGAMNELPIPVYMWRWVVQTLARDRT